MLRLYLRFYLALVLSLVLFVLATATLWHFTGDFPAQAGVTLGRLVHNVLPPATASGPEQQAALQKLLAGVDENVTLFGSQGERVASVGQPVPFPLVSRSSSIGMVRSAGARLSYVHLADGRWLVVNVPIGYAHERAVFHLMLVLLAVAIGVGAYPIVRQISGRLERLQRGVESLGAGDLGARVAVEGQDEVARLATSFNRAAGQIEQLVEGHKSLLANTSHELRTPLARIRLAVELLTPSVDEKRKRGLELDIAELDTLVDEILLAASLDSVNDIAHEEVDLLALAAEECARYDEAQLEGSVSLIRGDPRLLRRLFRNLLENARRHGAPPTEVRIAHAEGRATITVWDAGPGIPATEFDRVFQPFYRPSASQNTSGFGLGLALVRQIARRHGGEARCAQLAETSSTGFIITLPM